MAAPILARVPPSLGCSLGSERFRNVAPPLRPPRDLSEFAARRADDEISVLVRCRVSPCLAPPGKARRNRWWISTERFTCLDQVRMRSLGIRPVKFTFFIQIVCAIAVCDG
jgi:hypothetical protein